MNRTSFWQPIVLALAIAAASSAIQTTALNIRTRLAAKTAGHKLAASSRRTVTGAKRQRNAHVPNAAIAERKCAKRQKARAASNKSPVAASRPGSENVPYELGPAAPMPPTVNSTAIGPACSKVSVAFAASPFFNGCFNPVNIR